MASASSLVSSAGGTAALAREVARAFPDRPFAIELWDGGFVEATRAGAPTIHLRDPAVIAQFARAPGQLGAGRAYVLGQLDTDDLDAVVDLIGRWQPPALGPGDRLRLGLAALRAGGIRRPPPLPATELRGVRNRHTKARDAETVRHHYDVSNEFYELFLDETMTYSCALFRNGAKTLEEAQRAKLELICCKLGAEPQTRMLDVGCGWGSLAIHAAREHGASVLGITLSEPQAALARERAAQAGVADRVEIRVLDYRELRGERFDAIASVGMVEHVGGEKIDDYARRMASLLAPGGLLLNHGIIRIPPAPGGAFVGGPFWQRYVFPDAELLNLWRMLSALEGAGLEPIHVESLRADYAETLRHWTQRFEARLDEAERIAGPERVRVWRLYLRAARNTFVRAENGVCQILCAPVVSA